MLHSPNRSRERILLYGGAGAGKTTSYLSIAELSQQTKSPAKFYILDSDNALDRMRDTLYGHLENIEVHIAYEWPDYVKFGQYIKSLDVSPDDFICIDFLSNSWKAIQEWYTNEIFGQDKADYFMKVRKSIATDAKTLSAFQGFTDWQVINEIYSKWVTGLIHMAKCHVIATATSEAVSDRSDSKATLAEYGFVGYRPSGQKNTPHIFHTVLFSRMAAKELYQVTTTKDRGHGYVERYEVSNFARDYMVKVAKWSLR